MIKHYFSNLWKWITFKHGEIKQFDSIVRIEDNYVEVIIRRISLLPMRNKTYSILFSNLDEIFCDNTLHRKFSMLGLDRYLDKNQFKQLSDTIIKQAERLKTIEVTEGVRPLSYQSAVFSELEAGIYRDEFHYYLKLIHHNEYSLFQIDDLFKNIDTIDEQLDNFIAYLQKQSPISTLSRPKQFNAHVLIRRLVADVTTILEKEKEK